MNIIEDIEPLNINSNVLIVDDNDLILRLTKNYLQAEKFTVFTANDGASAIDMLNSDTEFDLVVLDILLPDTNGYEICKFIRQRFSLNQLPVLFLTGLKETANLVEGFMAGGNDYLVKPFNGQEFIVRSRTLIKLKHLAEANVALKEAVNSKNKALAQLQHEIAYRLKIEKELIKAKEDADKANKLKSEFLANMSHEIRTPLNAILGFGELLKKYISDERGWNYLDSITASGKSLLVIINDILDLSKIDAGKVELQPEFINIKQVVRDISKIFELTVQEKALDFIISIDDKVPELLNLDEGKFRQIMLNIVGNATKFTKSGKIEVQLASADSYIDKNSIALLLQVIDTGIGISDNDLNKIFEPFQQQEGQSTKSFGGTGLGLTITKRLIEMMGGIIEVKSIVGKGSTFSVFFPSVHFQDPSFIKAIKNEVPDSQFDFEKSTVLFIDDNPHDLNLMAEYLSEVNLRIIKQDNPRHVLKTLKQTRPDIIFCDIKMPEMDGYAVRKQIKSNKDFASIPVIAMTAYGLIEELDKIKSENFDGFLIKPIKKNDLLYVLKKYLKFNSANSGDKALTDYLYIKDIGEYEIDKGLMKSLKDIYLNDYKNVVKSYRISSIVDFAVKLTALAEQYSNGSLSGYGKHLIKLCDDLDMKNIKASLGAFPEIFANEKDSF